MRTSKVTACDHEQIDAMFAGYELGHSAYRIESTLSSIEARHNHDRKANDLRMKRELMRLSKNACPYVKQSLVEAGLGPVP